MMRSPADRKATKGSNFRLDPPNLVLADKPIQADGAEPDADTRARPGTPEDDLQHSGTTDISSEMLLADSVFAESQDSPLDDDGGLSHRSRADEATNEDPFTKLHKLMRLHQSNQILKLCLASLVCCRAMSQI